MSTVSESRWPFRKVFVDHLFHGTTRVWWEFEPSFAAPDGYSCQLQASYAGHASAADWTAVGDPVSDAVWLETTRSRDSGKTLLTHYRVILTRPSGESYASAAAPIWGTLAAPEWRQASEIARREHLRLDRVGRDGFLLRRYRYGAAATPELDPLTDAPGGVTRVGWGSGVQPGYHPACPLRIELVPASSQESRGAAGPGGNSVDAVREARTVAQPDIANGDLWVDAVTDERWEVLQPPQTVADIRGYPIVRKLSLGLLAFDDPRYRIPVSPLSADPNVTAVSQQGTGCVAVDHDYGGEGSLSYVAADCCPVSGAVVRVFPAADWAAMRRDPANAIASTRTTTGGQWLWAVRLDPGEYVLQFEKPGEYGPDTQTLIVEAEIPAPSTGSSSASDFWSV